MPDIPAPYSVTKQANGTYFVSGPRVRMVTPSRREADDYAARLNFAYESGYRAGQREARASEPVSLRKRFVELRGNKSREHFPDTVDTDEPYGFGPKGY